MKKDKKNTIFNKFSFVRFLKLFSFSILIALVVVNIISIFSVDADQFNIFHKYDKVYRLETWNIPNYVDVDINGDGMEDRMTFTGCLTLSGTLDKDIDSKQYDCNTDQSKGISVFRIEKSSLPQIRLSYVGKINKSLDIVLIKNLQTDLFNINGQGDVIRRKTPFSLKLDTVAYFISHLFVLITGM